MLRDMESEAVNIRIEIAPGLSLRHIKTDKFKTCGVALLLRRDLWREEATMNALLPRVLRMGCAKYPNMLAVNRELESMSGAVFESGVIKKGGEQILQFYLESSGTPIRSLVFLRDILLEPLTEEGAFLPQYVRLAKENLRQDILSRPNNKPEYALLRCIEEMCAGEPFGVYGDGYAEDLTEIDAHRLYVHYKRLLASSEVTVMVVGDCETMELMQLCKRLFGAELGGTSRPAIVSRHQAKPEARVFEPLPMNQAQICIGLRGPVMQRGTEYYSLLAANEILGGSALSRLFVNIRERESLCYSINSRLLRFTSMIMVQAGVEREQVERTIELIKNELRKAAKVISEKELENAKRSLHKRLLALGDNPARLLDFYLGQDIAADPDDFEAAIENVNKVEAVAAAKALAGMKVEMVMALIPQLDSSETVSLCSNICAGGEV